MSETDAMTVHRYLVTSEIGPRMDAWAPTAPFANWIEGRRTPGRAGVETWLVTCFSEHAQAFLDAARATGVTVEEIEGAGETEAYRLLIGEPGSGWADVHGKPLRAPAGARVMTQCCPMDTFDTDSAGNLRATCECLDGCTCMCPDCACESWGDDGYDDGPQ